MVDFFDKLYAAIQSRSTFLNKLRFYSLQRYIIRKTANWLLPIYFIYTNKNKRYTITESAANKKREQLTIVSLTSFPARIKNVWLVIETLLRQTHKPDKIILWLSKEQFKDKTSLPEKLLAQESRGLEIRMVDEDLRSHKKYYYTIIEFANDILITVDDDIFYNSRTIDELYRYHKKYPNSVIARYAYKTTWTDEGILNPYNEWIVDFMQIKPRADIFFGSGGGTLFPIKILPKETLNKNVFTKNCFYADDVWLNTMCRLKKIGIFRVKNRQCSLLPVLIKNNLKLSSDNMNNNQNDTQLKKTRMHYINTLDIDLFKKDQ